MRAAGIACIRAEDAAGVLAAAIRPAPTRPRQDGVEEFLSPQSCPVCEHMKSLYFVCEFDCLSRKDAELSLHQESTSRPAQPIYTGRLSTLPHGCRPLSLSTHTAHVASGTAHDASGDNGDRLVVIERSSLLLPRITRDDDPRKEERSHHPAFASVASAARLPCSQGPVCRRSRGPLAQHRR